VGVITHWIGCLTRSLCACRSVWSAAAMLPHQPCFVPGARHAIAPAATRITADASKVKSISHEH
ncbi:hypothetical protein, partial [Chloroflexus sp.]|uniref:hypothetical protein n=1 Tax=Chloroflexus sp. TaxID=1904827 RepID=UPI002ADE778A